VPIERHSQRFEIACWWALVGFGFGQFTAARLALAIVRGNSTSMADVEGLLRLSQIDIPLPLPNPDEPNAQLRRLAAKALRQSASGWLVHSSGLIQALAVFHDDPGATCLCLDELLRLGWRPVLSGFAQRIETALKSNVPPADLEELSPAAHRLLARVRGNPKK
jgi:hypothetical protein